jgi:hypothetical protein
MRVRSKKEGRMKSLLIQMPKGMRGPSTASVLARQLGIDFALLLLDSTPFLHGFGESDAKLTVARWMLPVENLDGEDVELESFLVLEADLFCWKTLCYAKP